MPQLLGIGAQQVEYLKLFSGQDLDTLIGRNWAIFLTSVIHHFSPWSHSLLQTEIQFGFEYVHTWWVHLLQCFDQKFIFLVHFSKW